VHDNDIKLLFVIVDRRCVHMCWGFSLLSSSCYMQESIARYK